MTSRVNLINAKDLYNPVPLLENPQKYGKPFQPKVHVSTWFITLNSNRTTGYANNIGSYLVQILENLFKKQENLLQFLEFNYKDLGISDNEYTLTESMLNDRTLFPDVDGVKNFQLSYIEEEGPMKKRVHLHAEFQVIHYTNLRINLTKLHKLLSQQLKLINAPFDSAYINVRYIPSALPIYNYMLKSQKNMKKVNKFIGSDSEYDEALSMLSNFQI